ncbi:hypothetical protein [Rariglobus hedericola]|uniref:DUF3887 domain-containing protein n=1 Tax=Rariglobus hedericola TaxID=2597822 RepID=A0A556QSB9_9BACT|nr:hypothetical protein [Rariglobus hedericola]TSJ79531.1 hypothetical protein FPL22_09665 [Rariglobus hedericola]
MKTPFALLLLGSLLAFTPATTFAQTKQPVPELINQGLNAYAQSGLNTALQIWLQNSLLDRGTLLRGELAALKQADATYGLFESGEVMHVAIITPRVTRVYLVLYYERAPLWAWFDLYKTRSGHQVISDVFFSPKVQVILPADVSGL